MQPEEVARAVQSGRDYVDEEDRAGRHHRASCRSTTSLTVDQDFTSDRAGAARGAQPPEPASEGSGTAAATDPETDAGHGQRVRGRRHRVQHLQHRPPARGAAVARRRAGGHRAEEVGHLLQQRHDADGHGQPGRDPRVVDRAVRANVSIYAADTRGLQALPAGGDASQASVRGTGAFSGRSMSSQREQLLGRAGHAVDARRGHGRQGVLRRQRVRRGVRQGGRRTPRPTTCSATPARTRRRTGGSAASGCARSGRA